MTSQTNEIDLQKKVHNCYFINNLNLISSKTSFTNSKPIKHIFLDNLWNETFLSQVSEEINNFSDWEGEKKFYGSELKRYQSQWEKFHSELPIFNKTLMFITDDHSFHGQPNPVKNVDKSARNSIATYYYQSIKPENTSEVKRTDTNYVNKFGKPEKGKIKDRIKLKIKKIFKF
tara:strand:+ start:1847 stop:2368 length:522 start_codon:yes stop_codon:yes gene_type:complete